MPSDAIRITEAEYRDLLDSQDTDEIIPGENPGDKPRRRPKVIRREQRVEALSERLDNRLQRQARDLGFRNSVDAVSYADAPEEPIRQAAAIRFRAWRSLCWVEFDAQTASGPLPQPQALLAALPDY